MNIKVGDILDFTYTGTVQVVTLPKGKYTLECWGAQGGYRDSSSYGGKGGKSYGILTLVKPTLLYIYVGGSGNTDCTFRRGKRLMSCQEAEAVGLFS